MLLNKLNNLQILDPNILKYLKALCDDIVDSMRIFICKPGILPNIRIKKKLLKRRRMNNESFQKGTFMPGKHWKTE